jgi:hypothetical protein
LIRYCGPAKIDRRLRDSFLYRSGALNGSCRGNDGRGNLHDFSTDYRSWRIHLHSDLPLQTQALNRLPTLRTQLVVARPLIDDNRVVIGDVGDVGRLVNDGHILLRRHDDAFDLLFPELRC